MPATGGVGLMDYTGTCVNKPAYPIAIVMQRRAVTNRWVDCIWEPWSVLAGTDLGEARLLVQTADAAQWIHPGFELVLHKDELEGYYLNVSAPEPRVFVLWRMESGSEGEFALPAEVTVSSEEAARWMDGGHSVDGVAIPPAIFAWVGEYVENNYRPQPQKRFKPRSFQHPKDRV
jgi:hypothetical protein